MSDQNQTITTIGLVQQWIETSTGKHARLMGAALMGQTTASDEVLLGATTSGALYSQLQPSTASIGILGVSTAAIGHVILDASTAKIGALQASTESIGLVTALVSTAKIGALQASTESIGLVTLLVSTAAIGSLIASTEKIGALQPSTEAIGLVTLQVSTAEIGSLAAGNNHIGQVGGNSAFPSAAIAVTTSGAYSTGDVMGSTMTFSSCFRSTSVMTGILQSVVVTDLSTAGQSAIDLWLFQTVTTGSTFTNDAAATIADADLTKLVAKVSITSGDYYQFADNAAAVISNLGIPIQATTGTGLTGIAVCRSTGPSYATTSDLSIQLGILQD